MDLLSAIIAVVLGVVLIIWTAHLVLTILGWILVIGGAIWLFRHLVGHKGSRTDL